MTTRPPSHGESHTGRQVVSLQIGSEQTLVYDAKQSTAWIQADHAIHIEEVQ